MNRITLSMIVAICACASILLADATLMMPEREGPPGSTVKIPVIVLNADSLAGVEFVIEFDDALLEFAGIDSSGVQSDFLMASKETENKVAVSMARAEGLQQQREGLLQLLFRIRQSATLGDATEITLSEYSLFDNQTNSIPCNVEHGVIRVSDIAVYPNPITPNGDTINDIAYFIFPDSLAESASVKIYGLAGDMVREIDGTSQTFLQWDGRNSSGTVMKPGVYLYVLLVNDEALKQGSITIMR